LYSVSSPVLVLDMVKNLIQFTTMSETVMQYLSDETIAQSRRLSVSERLEFLEEFRLMVAESAFQKRIEEYQRKWEGRYK